tara:strand:- start:824 stop:1885 length:1062 start_codon:yes stop_codon:yes gene_type:complete
MSIANDLIHISNESINFNLNEMIETRCYSVDAILFMKSFWDDPPINFEDKLPENIKNNTEYNFYKKNDNYKRRNGKWKKNYTNTNIPVKVYEPLKTNEETRWTPKFVKNNKDINGGSELNSEQIKQKINMLLNKLTNIKFTKLSDKIIELFNKIDNEQTLKDCILLIIQKAQNENNYCEMYSKLCLKINKESSIKYALESNNIKLFKNILLNFCQQDFINVELDQVIQAKKKWINLSQDELDEKNLWASQCKKGHVRFIANLYLQNMLSNRIIYRCIDHCFYNINIENQEKLIYLVELLKITGCTLERKTNKNIIDIYFEKINELSASDIYSMRIQFALKDIINLHNNNYNDK